MNNIKNLPEVMVCSPSVFAMDGCYKILIPFRCEAVVRVHVGGETYYDDSNGILRSANPIHQVEVPKDVLDAAGEYTVSYRVMLERKPYFPTSEDPVEITFPFHPVRGDDIRIYHVADTHNMPVEPAKSYRNWGKQADLLVLNGDIPNHSGEVENFYTTFEIASEITGGSIPVVFSRGNHDTRGLCAEKFAEYTPTSNGRTYYTFRAGALWGMVLDCGEDKPDSHDAYGDTVCFHTFRKRETEFIRRVIANAATEYAAPDVKYRVIICHIPFTFIHHEPFDIEQELYGEWTRIISDKIAPDFFLFGHEHKIGVWEKGSEHDSFGQNCGAIIGAIPLFDPDAKDNDSRENKYVGCGLEISPKGVHVDFCHSRDGIMESRDLLLTQR